MTQSNSRPGLSKQLVPIPFNKGIDTKSDDKNIASGQLLELENGVFTNPGKIRKRNGFVAKPRSAVGGNVASGKGLSAFQNELVQFTGREMLGFSETEQAWINRGYDFSLNSISRSIVNNNNEQRNPETCVDFGFEVYVWEDSSGGVRYSVIDSVNRSIIVANQTVDSFGFRPKVVSWEDQFVILYSVVNGSTVQMFAREIDPSTPFAISNAIPLLSDLNPNGPQFDALITTDGYFYIGYSQTVTDGYGTHNYSVLAHVLSLGALTKYQFTRNSVSAINLFEDSGKNVWLLTSGFGQAWVAGIHNNGTTVNSGFLLNTGNCLRLMGYENTNSGNVVIFYEMKNDIDFTYGNILYRALVSKGSVILANKIFTRGVGLYSKAFSHGNDYFFTITFDSPLQATYILVNEVGTIVDRSNVNNGGGSKNNSRDGLPVGVCTDIALPRAGLYSIPFQIKTTIRSNNGVTFLPTGINVDDFDFNAATVFGNVFASGSLNVVGGVLKNYDGVNYNENNFLVYPEGVFLDKSVIVVDVIQDGAFGIAEITDMSFPAAYRIPANSYFTIGSTSADYYVWFRKDGIGTDPLPFGGVGVPIDISSTDSALQVASAVINGLPPGDFDAVPLGLDGPGIEITNKFTGVVTPPTAGTTTAGNIESGSYLYSVIYAYTDNNGLVQRSTSSIPVQILMTLTGSISIVVPTLRLSEKSNVRIEVYRTEGTNDGSTNYFRVSPLNPVLNDPSIDYVSFIDTLADEDIISNDLLYTVGGVLDNTAPPSSSMIVQYKNRLFIGGLEDKNLLWFSKYVFQDTAIQFSEFLTFKCDPRGGDITALGVLDDKLIIFKETAIWAVVGDGPSDTGGSNDYDKGATLISNDVGCNNTNSVVVMKDGIMFQSDKGMYILGHDLDTSYIGWQAERYNNLTVTSAVLSPNNNQVRFTTSDQMLVYDYLVKQWSVFTGLEATGATFVNDVYYLLKSDGVVYQENKDIYTDADEFIKLKITTGWIAVAGLQGFERVYRALFLGSYYGPHLLQASFAYDYNSAPGYFMKVDATTLVGNNAVWGSDGYWGQVGTVWGGSYVPYQWRCRVKKQKCQAIRITVEDLQSAQFNQGFDISAITLEIGIKEGGYKLPAKNSFGNG